MLWLTDRSAEATAFAKDFLLGHAGVGNDINGNPSPYTQSGLQQVFAGADAATYFGTAPGDSRVPDVFGIAQYGVVYTGGHGKIAEHGGANPQDRAVPLVVSGPPVANHEINTQTVETTQIAPTILALLGLDPKALQSVQIEHTRVLPDVTRHDLLALPGLDGSGLLSGLTGALGGLPGLPGAPGSGGQLAGGVSQLRSLLLQLQQATGFLIF